VLSAPVNAAPVHAYRERTAAAAERGNVEFAHDAEQVAARAQEAARPLGQRLGPHFRFAGGAAKERLAVVRWAGVGEGAEGHGRSRVIVPGIAPPHGGSALLPSKTLFSVSGKSSSQTPSSNRSDS
jgi:hypothetical protein